MFRVRNLDDIGDILWCSQDFGGTSCGVHKISENLRNLDVHQITARTEKKALKLLAGRDTKSESPSRGLVYMTISDVIHELHQRLW